MDQQQDLISSGASKGESVSLSFPAFSGHLQSLAHGLLFHLQIQQHSISQTLPLS